jgi:hypothetical protein
MGDTVVVLSNVKVSKVSLGIENYGGMEPIGVQLLAVLHNPTLYP